MRNKKKKPRGFLFVTFASAAEAETAVDIIDGCMYGDRCLNSNIVDIQATPAPVINKKRPINPARGVHISNLDYSLTDDELWQMCDDIVGVGLLTALKIPVDKETKQARGYAHLEFIDEQARDKAIREIDGLEVLGRQLSARPLTFRGLKKKPPSEDASIGQTVAGQYDVYASS